MWPAVAPAATISLDLGAVAYKAAPGEINVLDVRLEGTAVVFTETSATITDAAFCTTRSPGVVVCVRAGRTRALRIPLSSKGVNAVRRAGKLAVRLVVEIGDRRRVTAFSLHTSL